MKINRKRVAAWVTLMGLSAGIGYTAGIANAEVEVREVKVVEYVITASNEPLAAPTSLGDFRITAYCPCEKCCGDFANGITATGTVATEGRTIAADPKVLPYGTAVLIDGKEYIVEDCGGAIKGKEIDMYFDSHEEALRWGVQTKEVYTK